MLSPDSRGTPRPTARDVARRGIRLYLNGLRILEEQRHGATKLTLSEKTPRRKLEQPDEPAVSPPAQEVLREGVERVVG
mgnify:CR=1 FL=1